MSFHTNRLGKLIKYFPEKPEADVVIPDGVEIIGSKAFKRCNDLNSVIIPESVVEIEDEAFLECRNLLYIEIPDSVEKIGYEAFRCCDMLEGVKLPRTLKFLKRGAFSGCVRLSEIIFPDEVTKIEKYTFLYCTRLANMTLPKNLIEIGENAFFGCQSLKSIEIPEGVTEIGEKAFQNSGLSRAVIPRSIKTIGGSAFLHTDKLVTNIPIAGWQNSWGMTRVRYALNYINSYTAGDPFFDHVKEENNQAIKDLLYDIELEFSPENDIKALWYLIKEELLEIEDIEFFSEKMINDLEITAVLLDYKNAHVPAEYMEQWERDKLDKALGIKEYTRSDWSRIFKLVKYDGEYAVQKYRGSDETVVVPGKIEGLPVTAIQPLAFEKIGNIKSVFIGEGVTHIAPEAFSGCTQLAEITLPESLRSIGREAFFECENLTEITIPSEVKYIGNLAFCKCSSLARVTLPDKITAIENFAFCNTAISEIVIPEGVEAIEEYAFSICENLSNITFPKSLQRIEGYAFIGCHRLKRIVLYDDLCDISNTAFADIEKLTIAAPAGSYAMKFASGMGYEFEELEPEIE